MRLAPSGVILDSFCSRLYCVCPSLCQLCLGVNSKGKRIPFTGCLFSTLPFSPVLTHLWKSHREKLPPAYGDAASRKVTCMPTASGNSWTSHLQDMEKKKMYINVCMFWRSSHRMDFNVRISITI